MQFLRHKRRRVPSVIIVSLIDVLLVVLIFLMVTTTFKRNQPSLKLALPKSEVAKPGASKIKPFLIGVTTNAPYFYLENQPVTLDRLRKELEAAVRRDPQLKVQIRADKQAPFGEVIRIIDMSKLANVGSIDAVTERVGAR
jgi:biopolymer transport protein ExbD